MEQALGHFVTEDGLTHRETDALVEWTGRITCQGGYGLAVQKLQHVRIENGRPLVRTYRYAYVAMKDGRPLFRYDTYHPHPGHPDAHHKHHCDALGNEIYPPEHVGHARWPTLGEVLRELCARWEEDD
jgi:hypothetical protein